jgi:excisionase family DNA binding protein
MRARRTPLDAASAPAPRPAELGDSEHTITVTLGLSEQLLGELGERLADLLAERANGQAESPWLTLPAAAAYLGFTRDKLYKLSAARALPFRKKRDGQGLLFRRDDLDQWVETAYQRDGWLA